MKYIRLLFTIVIFNQSILGDSFNFNTYNNHGSLGLINIPTARFYDEGSFGFTLYNGNPDQKMTLTSSPYDWLEASLFYTNIDNNPQGCNFNTCYKDKGFNFKIRLKEEGKFPAVAIGLNDIGGTGLYNSEFIVASYGINKLDMHFGLGWGNLNNKSKFKNPLTYLYEGFSDRPIFDDDLGGEFQLETYFSGDMTPFYGLSYSLNKSLLIKIEKDSSLPVGFERFKGSYDINSSDEINYGFDYLINDNLTIGFSKNKNNYFSFRFSYKKSPLKKINDLKSSSTQSSNSLDPNSENNYSSFIENLNKNKIGVNRIYENAEKVGIEVTQFSYSNLGAINEIIQAAKNNNNINKPVEIDYKLADLEAYSSISKGLKNDSNIVFERQKTKNFSSSTKLNIRPFLAAREDFFKFSLLLENNNEYIFRDNFFFSSNLKYSIYDNFDELFIPPRDTYPAQVRSDVKDYMNNFGNNIIIGRAQFDYYLTPKKNNHIMFTVGILEEMFSGYGIEYLNYKQNSNIAYGFEVFHVKKRDYKMNFKHLDYDNVTSAFNFYYRNYGALPFDAKISAGEYLAGDLGATFELSRSYKNGMKFGVFATFTNVSSEQFGEGSFDKGLFFTIPIFTNNVDYTWRPLTKDPGARLNRKNNLYDLLVKFRPIN